MLERPGSRRFKTLFGSIGLTMLAALPPVTNQQPDGRRQARALVDLAARILSCSGHPCLGDREDAVRALLPDQIVTDGVFHFSDLAAAYPSFGHTLSGLVEWDLGGSLDMVSLKVTDFHVPPEAVVAEIESALPGCVMEQDEDDEDEPASQPWSCGADGPGGTTILIEAYFASGIALLEIGP